MLRKLWLPFFTLFLIPLFGLAQTNTENSDRFLGEASEGKYRNAFFGFALTLPPDMYVFSDQERAIYTKAGVAMFAKDIGKNRKAYEKAAQQEVLLFTLAVNKPALSGVSSLNIGVVKQPEGVTPADMCDTAANFFIRNPNYKLTSKTQTMKRAGKDFAKIELTAVYGAQTVALRYYAMMRKGYSVTFVITHLSKADLDSLEKVLDSLEFF